MKKRDNNRGFTLVELIIAVAILAIAVSPLIANFIQSSKMNYQGRQDLDAMNLAQDIMEGLSGYTVDEACANIDKVIADTTNTESLKGGILPLTSDYVKVEKKSADTDTVVKYEIQAVETINDINNVYNVELVFDPTGTDQEEFNNQEVAEISNVNQYYDAVYTIPTETDLAQAISRFQEITTNTLTPEFYYGKLKRETTITIQNATPTGPTPEYKVTVARTYKAAQGETGVLGIGNSDSHTITVDNISRMSAEEFPRSVYIYFRGIDGANYSGGERKESFIIENTTGNPITVYLIRTQKTVSGNALPEEVTYGSGFGCEVAIVSKDTNGNYTQDVHLVSNLRYNLNAPSPRYNFRVTTEDGQPIYDAAGEPNVVDGKKLGPEIPKKDDGTKMLVSESTYINARALYVYNTQTVTEEVYRKCFSDGYMRKDKNTIYKVTINLYDKKTNKKVATYDGGLAN